MNDLTKPVSLEIFSWPPPDRTVVRWMHAGMHCAVSGGGWSFCGYVLVPATHPCANADTDSKLLWDLDVHGDVTFCEKFPEGTWLGWDAGHCFDETLFDSHGKRWLVKDMVDETNRLAVQLAEQSKPKVKAIDCLR